MSEGTGIAVPPVSEAESTEIVDSLLGETTEAVEAAKKLERSGIGALVAAYAARDELPDLQRLAKSLSRNVAELSDVLGRLSARANDEAALWSNRRRFSGEGLQVTIDRIRDKRERDNRAGATRMWLVELVAACVSGERQAALTLAGAVAGVDLPEGARAELEKLRTSLARQGDDVAFVDPHGADLLLKLITHSNAKLAVSVRAQARLVQAFAYWSADRVDDAVHAMDEALEQIDGSARLEGQRAGLSIAMGDVDDALSRARRVIDLAPEEPYGYWYLGTALERSGQYDDAVEFYGRGARRASLVQLERAGHGATFLGVSGLLERQVADRLLKLDHPVEALARVESALRSGLAGSIPYPDAVAHALRSKVLDRLGRERDAGEAAFTAGKFYLWNNEVAASIPLLAMARNTSPALEDAGWFYADALMLRSWPENAARPDLASLDQARKVWTSWRDHNGAPKSAWPYRTRARLEWYAAERMPELGEAPLWQAVTYLERALVLAPSDSATWGLSASIFAQLGLDQLAMVSADQGFAADPDDLRVLDQRLSLLANAGRFDEAELALERLVEQTPDSSQYIGVRAWILFHQQRYEEAIHWLDQAASTPYAWFGWLLALRASCYVQLSRFDKAREDLKRMLTLTGAEFEQSATCQALAALGRVSEASDLVVGLKAELGENATAPARRQVLELEATVALVSGDVAEARLLAQQVLATSRSRREAADAVVNWHEAVVLGAQDEVRQRVEPLVEELRDLAASITIPVASASEELNRASEYQARNPDETSASLSVLAITGRLAAAAGKDVEAAAAYRRLQEAGFEPEATIALTAALEREFERAVSGGRADDAESYHRELQELGSPPHNSVQEARSDALRMAGRLDEAKEVLDALPLAQRANLSVTERLGELCLLSGDIAGAATAFRRGLEQVQDSPVLRAQVEARLAAALAILGDGSSVDHLISALGALREASAASPSLVLGHELRGILDMVGSTRVGALLPALQQALERFDPGDVAGAAVLGWNAADPGDVADFSGDTIAPARGNASSDTR